jgi:hypothetical protein
LRKRGEVIKEGSEGLVERSPTVAPRAAWGLRQIRHERAVIVSEIRGVICQ